jgi:hypothetical protein
MAGQPVKCAGHFFTDNSGKLAGVDDQSGHYTPSEYEFGSFLYGLKHHSGIDLETVSAQTVSYGDRTAAELLGMWEQENLPGETLRDEEPDIEDDGAGPRQNNNEDVFAGFDPYDNPFT